MVYDVALSFAGEDRDYVEKVAKILKNSGVEVFYDKFEELDMWGKNLYDYLSDVYQKKARYTVIFISENYARKQWTSHERKSAQARAIKENEEYILPARFDNTEIPGINPNITYIDLSILSEEDFARKIIEKIGKNSNRENKTFIRVSNARNVVQSKITVIDQGDNPINNCRIVAVANNKTFRVATTQNDGMATLDLLKDKTYDLLIAHPGYTGKLEENMNMYMNPTITMKNAKNIGSLIVVSTGYIDGFEGRINPIFDTSNRTYIYADNIAINGGVNQPANFEVGIPLELEDVNGIKIQVIFLYIRGTVSLLEYKYIN